MKKIICLFMAAFSILLLDMAAFAQEGFETDMREIAVPTGQGDITLSVEGGDFWLGYRCMPEREMEIILPEKGNFKGEKLYLEIRGDGQAQFDAIWEGEFADIDGDLLVVSLDKIEGGQGSIDVGIFFIQKGLHAGQALSLWLLGGEEYGGNLLEGQGDMQLREDFVLLNEIAQKKTAIVKPGESWVDFNGTKIALHAPVYCNGAGQAMLAAEDIALVMEGVDFPGEFSWEDGTARLLFWGTETIEVTAGERLWEYMGKPAVMRAVPELQDGRLYVPLRDMAEALGMKEILWENGMVIMKG